VIEEELGFALAEGLAEEADCYGGEYWFILEGFWDG
jgi:hypothetical protein